MPAPCRPKAMAMVFSRPIWSETQPKNGRVNPLNTRSIDSAKLSAGSIKPMKPTGECVMPKSRAITGSSAMAISPATPTIANIRYISQKMREMLRSRIFWLMYLMFAMVGVAGLMAIAELPVIARDFGITHSPVGFIGLMLPALSFALSIDRVFSGLTRPFFGWVSDHIGRENTMAIAFGLQGAGIWALYAFGHDPATFVVLSGVVYFTWGEIYSLFPATCADTYGGRYASVNAGFLYTAKGTASLLVPLGAYLSAMTGGWHAGFALAGALNILAAALALLVLRPWRRAHAAANGTTRNRARSASGVRSFRALFR